MVRCGRRSGDEFPLAACPRQPRHRWSRLRLEEQVRRGKDSSAAGSGWSCCFKRANELPKVTESWSVSQISDNSVTCPNTVRLTLQKAKMPRLRTSEFGGRESLLTEKVLTEKTGGPNLTCILRKCRVQASSVSKEGKWEGLFL